jgi:hypothetical protein
MMLVGAGNFLMGSNSGSQDQSPAQTLFLSDFYIDKYEVTNETYKRCVEAGQCKPPRKDGSRTIIGYYSKPEYKKYPVIYVTWDMANDYCSWRGGRLPTEAEWEKAARGPDGHIYPWGNEASCDDANYSGCARKKETEPVNSYQDGRSFYNVMDLAGNVSEWVNSLYDNYPYDSAREDPVASGERVVRGGSFADTDQQVSAISRQKADPSIAQDTIGFRCVGMPANSINKSTLVTITPTMGLINGTQAAAKTKEHLTATTTALLQLNLTASPSTASTVTIVSLQDITATTEASTVPPTQSQAEAPTEVIETPTDVVKEAPTDAAATAVPTEPPIKTEPAPVVPPPTDPAPQGEPAPTDPGITP